MNGIKFTGSYGVFDFAVGDYGLYARLRRKPLKMDCPSWIRTRKWEHVCVWNASDGTLDMDLWWKHIRRRAVYRVFFNHFC